MRVAEVRDVLLDVSRLGDMQGPGTLKSDKSMVDALMQQHFTEERLTASITDEDVSALTEALHLRWAVIAGKESDYATVFDKGANQRLIELALQLKKAKLVDDPFTLLTTVSVLEDPISCITFKECGWDELFVREDGSLLHIPSFERYMTKTVSAPGDQVLPGYFRGGDFHPLTDDEKDRLHTRTSVDLMVGGDPSTRPFTHLKRSTVMAIRRLVEELVTFEGKSKQIIVPGSDTETQIINAYTRFINTLSTMEPSEKQALFDHPVRLSDYKWSTFYYLWDRLFGPGKSASTEADSQATESSDLCITTYMRPLVRLVLRYLPTLEFRNPEVQKWKVSEGWHMPEPGLAFSDCDDEVFKRYCFELMVSVLSREFNISMGGRQITFLGLPPVIVSETASEIFHRINKAKLDKQYKAAYVDIVEHIVPDAIKRGSRGRSDLTRQWMESIADETFFEPNRAVKVTYRIQVLRVLMFIAENAVLGVKEQNQYADGLLAAMSRDNDWVGVEAATWCHRLYHQLDKSARKKLNGYLSTDSGENLGVTDISKLLIDSAVQRALYYLSFKKVTSPGLYKSTGTTVDHTLFKELVKFYQGMPKSYVDESFVTMITQVIDALDGSPLKKRIQSYGRQKAMKFTQTLEDKVWLTEDEDLAPVAQIRH